MICFGSISKGDRVALFMQNCPQYVIAHFAAQKLRAIAGPVNPMSKEWEMEYELGDMGAKAIVAAADLYPVLEKALARLPVLEMVTLAHYADMAPEKPACLSLPS